MASTFAGSVSLAKKRFTCKISPLYNIRFLSNGLVCPENFKCPSPFCLILPLCHGAKRVFWYCLILPQLDFIPLKTIWFCLFKIQVFDYCLVAFGY